jgi:poly(A) polymerase
MRNVPIAKDIIAQTLDSEYGRHAYEVAEKLQDAGYDTWWVGGGVRDMLKGHIPKDIDIATSAKPEEIAKVFGRSSGGEHTFGSMRVSLGKDTFEVTTFREDDEASDGRHPESIIYGTREQDGKRRDFTVNALYYNPVSQEFYDPFGGEGDLEENLIKFIGEPSLRIKHDLLRMFRAVRFRALLNGQYEPETYRAIQELAFMVNENLSAERVMQELEKMLAGPHPDRAFEDLWELGLLKEIWPELHACKGVAQPADYHHEGDVWEHTLLVIKSFRPEHGPDVRLAALLHDIGKTVTFSRKERIRFDEHATKSAEIVQEILTRMRQPKKRIEKICWLVGHHMMMGTFAKEPNNPNAEVPVLTEERKAHWFFHPWFAELLQVFWLDAAGTEPSSFDFYEAIVKEYDAFLDSHPRPEKPFLTGNDIIEILGIGPGARVGEILQALHDAQTRKEVTSKAEAKIFVEKFK